jgi:DNA-binding LacI/PurR family transcriptional regulator
VIDQLNYRPSKEARNLAARNSNTLGVITYGMRHYGPTQMVVNIEHAARMLGYDLIFVNIDPTADNDIALTIEQMTQWSIAGLLVIAPVSSNPYQRLLEQFPHIPMIQIDITAGVDMPSVVIDQYTGSYQITRHLLELGHTRLCEICGPLDWFGARARHDGMLKALKESQLTLVASMEGKWTVNSGFSATQHLLEHHEFTALIVANDQMALGAISALNQRGLRVPGDVSVVGFDDIPEAAFYLPPLTTVRQDFSELGRQGLHHLIDLIQNPDALGGQRIIPTQLVVRESTAPPNK